MGGELTGRRLLDISVQGTSSFTLSVGNLDLNIILQRHKLHHHGYLDIHIVCLRQREAHCPAPSIIFRPT